MRITVSHKKEEEDKKKKKPPLPPAEDEMEEELDWPPFQAVNLQKSAFDSQALNRREGVNTAPSVFDRQCVFRVKPGP